MQGVANTAWRICEQMKMNDADLKFCMTCAYLHDVGKILIPSEILQKKGRLTDEEYEVIKTHASLGYDICMKFDSLRQMAPIVRAHHESFDGTGYPDKLVGDQIPYFASLIKVADVYDALTRKRQYKDGYKQSDTFRIMIEDAEKNKMSAKFLFYLLESVFEELEKEINKQGELLKEYKDEIKTLNDLNEIFKQIYDQGYTPKLAKKLERYELAPGYDVTRNSELLVSKQNAMEKEEKKYQELLEEYDKLSQMYDKLKKLAKAEKIYSGKS